MKKLILICMMLLGAVAMQAQNSDQGLIGRAIGAATQNGCFDDVGPALHATATGVVSTVRVPCGPAITGIGKRVYLYAPTPCPPQSQVCIQVIVPIAEVIFGCGNQVLSVTCLDNPVIGI